MISDIEDALVAQWSHFGRWPRGELHDEGGILWFETPIEHLPYNGVLRTHLDDEAGADERISGLVERFGARGVQFFWVVHPSATPPDLGERLAATRLEPVERMNCMSLELDGWEPPPLPEQVVFEEVVDDAAMDAYAELTVRYWEIPADQGKLVAEVHRYWGPGRAQGHRYLALRDGVPIGKAYLSLAGPPGVASIYGMSVVPEARGGGVASGLTTTLLARGKAAGCERAVLHSTDMAANVYRRAGFVEHCTIGVFGTTSLWSGDH